MSGEYARGGSTMTRREARRRIRRWIANGLVRRRPYTYTYALTTQHETTAELFREAVEALDGWIVEHYGQEFRYRGRRHLVLTANIPDLEIRPQIREIAY